MESVNVNDMLCELTRMMGRGRMLSLLTRDYRLLKDTEALSHGKRKRKPFVVLWCAGMFLSIFFVQETAVLALIVLASLFLSILILLTADVYVFYRPAVSSVYLAA